MWINKDDLIAALARGVVVQAAVIAVFGERAKDFEVVHALDKYAFGLRSFRTGEVVAEQTYDPAVDFTVEDAVVVVRQVASRLGVTA